MSASSGRLTKQRKKDNFRILFDKTEQFSWKTWQISKLNKNVQENNKHVQTCTTNVYALHTKRLCFSKDIWENNSTFLITKKHTITSLVRVLHTESTQSKLYASLMQAVQQGRGSISAARPKTSTLSHKWLQTPSSQHYKLNLKQVTHLWGGKFDRLTLLLENSLQNWTDARKAQTQRRERVSVLAFSKQLRLENSRLTFFAVGFICLAIDKSHQETQADVCALNPTDPTAPEYRV